MQAQLSTRGFRYRSSLGSQAPGAGSHLHDELMAQGTGQIRHACCARHTPFSSSIPAPLVLFYDTRDGSGEDAGWGRLRRPGGGSQQIQFTLSSTSNLNQSRRGPCAVLVEELIKFQIYMKCRTDPCVRPIRTPTCHPPFVILSAAKDDKRGMTG